VLFGLQRFGWLAAMAFVVQLIKLAAVALLWFKAQGLIVLAGLLLGLGAAQGVVLTVLAVVSVRRARRVAAARAVREAAAPPPAAADAAAAPMLGGVLRYCLPLLGARAAFLSGQNLSRVVLGAFMSLEDLGYFSFAFTVVDRFVGFLYAIPGSLLPSFTQLVAHDDRERFRMLLDKAFRLVATAAAALAAGLFLFAPELTRVVGGAGYLPAVPVLAILGLVPWARTAQQPVTLAFNALRQTGRVLRLALLKLATEIGAYLLLIPLLGVLGAAWASLAGAALSLAAALFLLGRSEPPSRPRWVVMGKTTTLIALAVGAGAALGAAGGAAGPVGFWIALAGKVLVAVPACLLLVFLLDLVTEDDLQRAAGVTIERAWIRWVRDRGVRAGIVLSRAARPLRPRRFGTAESH